MEKKCYGGCLGEIMGCAQTFDQESCESSGEWIWCKDKVSDPKKEESAK